MKVKLLLSICLIFSTVCTAQELLKVKVKNRGGSVVAYSNDDEYLAINSNKSLQVYNAGSNVQIKTFNGFSKHITSIAFSSDDSKVMASSADGSIKIWSVLGGNIISEIKHDKGIVKALYVSDKQVAYISERRVALYDLEEGKELWSKPIGQKSLRALAVNAKGNLLALGGGDQLVHLLDLATGRELRTLKYHNDWVRSLAFHPYKTQLASGADDGQIVLWDTESGQVTNFLDNVNGRVYDLKFSNDASVLAYVADKAYFYSMEKGYKALELKDFDAVITSMDLSPDGKEVVTQEDFIGSFKIWDISSLNIQRIYKLVDETDKTPPQIYVSNPVNIKTIV